MGAVPRLTLCGVCRDLDLATKLQPPMDTYRLLATLRGSHIRKSRRRCTLCAFLFNAFKLSGQSLRNGSFRRKDEIIHLNATAKDGEPGCRIELSIGDAEIDCAITLIGSLPYHKPLVTQYMLPGASVQSFKPISGRTIENTVSWPLLRGWVDHCCKGHMHDTTPALPEFGRATKRRKWASTFRLVDVKDKCVVEADMSTSYAAFSYVWGGSKPVRLIQQNMQQLMTKGGLSTLPYLPQTFRDAMHAAEQLGISYLWIDALCIQHDDDVDLNHQINGMDQIYREATMTIVSVTPNANSAMPGVRTGTRDSTSLRYNAPGVDIMYARPSLESSIAQSDWESRGWTLQEKFFSKRLLYFTTHQAFFRCGHASWAEDAVLEPSDFKMWSGAVVALDDRSQLSGTQTLLHDMSSSPPVSKSMSLLESFLEYQDLLQQYMTRNLTRDTDILAAISGILNSFEDELGASVFGLPGLVFGAALLWYGDPYARRRSDLPSWSWCGWVPERSREMSWLVIASTGKDENTWGWSAEPDMPRSMVIHDLSLLRDQVLFKFAIDIMSSPSSSTGSSPSIVATIPTPPPKPRLDPEYAPKSSSDLEAEDLDAKFIVPLPQPLSSIYSLDTQILPPSSPHHPIPPNLAASGMVLKQILCFECDTFFNEEHIQGDIKIALKRNLDHDRKRGRPPPVRLDFLIMSGSRENDTWFKHRQGTYAVPPAPLFRLKDISASVNVMLVKTSKEGVSERIWVFSIVMERELPETVRKTIYLA